MASKRKRESIAEKKKAVFSRVVVKLQRSVEIVAQYVRLLMCDIIKPFWTHAELRVLPAIFDGFFTFAFDFGEPELDGDTGDLLIKLRCKTQSGSYVVPFSQTSAQPKGVTTRATAELRFSSASIIFHSHDVHWLRVAHSAAPPRPWLPGGGGLTLYSFPDGYWQSTSLELGTLRRREGLARYTQIIKHFETIYRKYEEVMDLMHSNAAQMKTRLVVPQQFRPQTLFFLRKPPNIKQQKRVNEIGAMEAGFSTATALGKKYWFQDSKEDMKIKIAWSNKICEQMQSMLQD